MKKFKIVLCVLIALCFVFAALSCAQEKTGEKTDAKKTAETAAENRTAADTAADTAAKTEAKTSESASGDVIDVFTAAIEKTFSGGAEYEMAMKLAGVEYMTNHVVTDGTNSRTETSIPLFGVESAVTYSDGEWNYSESYGMKSKTRVSEETQSAGFLDIDTGSFKGLFDDEDVKKAIGKLIADGTVEDTAEGKLYTVNYKKGDLDSVADKLDDLSASLDVIDTAKVEILINSEGYFVTFNVDISAIADGATQEANVAVTVINPGVAPKVTLPDDLDEYVDYGSEDDSDPDDDDDNGGLIEVDSEAWIDVCSELFTESGDRVDDFDTKYAELAAKYGADVIDTCVTAYEDAIIVWGED